MDAINYLYSTYTDPTKKNEYDLEDLGPIKRGGDLIMAFSDGRGNWEQITTDDRTAKLSDYDDLLLNMITSLEPVYLLDHCLDYHFHNFLESNYPEKNTFNTHLRHVVLPRLKASSRSAADLMEIWLNRQENYMQALHQQQRKDFLKRAYAAALEASPASPLSVSINVEGLAQDMQFDLNTAKRIVQELVGEQLATSFLGMKSFMITDLGRRFLEEQNEHSNTPDQVPIHFQVGDNSTVQFQSGSHHAVQQLEIRTENTESILTFLKEIKQGMGVLKEHLTEEQFTILSADTDYLESTLQRPNQNKGVIMSLLKGVVDIVKSIPGNVVANVITNGLPQIFS